MLYNFYIFARTGRCLYSREWHRTRKTNSKDEDERLMFGLLHSLKSFVAQMSPSDATGFHSVTTDNFRLHFFTTATGLMFALNSDPSITDMRDHLRHVYSELYVGYVSRNPMNEPGKAMDDPLFGKAVDEYFARMITSG